MTRHVPVPPDVPEEGLTYVRQALSTSVPYALVPPAIDDNNKAEHAFITVETAAARATFDGTTPTSGTNGHPVAAGQWLDLELVNLASVQFIADAAGAILHVSYLAS